MGAYATALPGGKPISAQNAQALSAAILKLCEDDPLRQSLAREAAESARSRFSTRALAKSTEAVYARVLASRGSVGPVGATESLP